MAASAVAVAAAVSVGCSQASRLDAKCVAGDVNSCTQLGDMYANGRGVPRDMARAGQSYERACNGGVADVCNTLGEFVEASGDIEGGPRRAEQLFQKACEGGSSRGCLNLGLAAAGREEFTLAVALYQRSCDGGWEPGCHELGLSYRSGEGAAKDMTKAISLFVHACEGEFVDSCVLLGNLYAAGEETPKDNAQAINFYGKALKMYQDSCNAGNAGDCTERDRLRMRVAVVSSAPAVNPPPGQPPQPEAGGRGEIR